MDSIALNKQIKTLDRDLRETNEAISEVTKHDNHIIQDLYEIIIKYVRELEIDDIVTPKVTHLFTSNLKELSGAVLHKTVFAFRLAYILEIQKI